MHGGQGHGKETHQNVRHGHVDDEDVGRVLHGLVPGHGQNDQQVAADADGEDDGVATVEHDPDPELVD